MAKLPEKTVPTSELKRRLWQELGSLELVNLAIKAGQGPKIEQQPVAETIERIVKIVSQLQARGKKIVIPIKLNELSPGLLSELELNTTVGRFFEQEALRKKLLERHGVEKLRGYQASKKAGQRRLSRPALLKKKPF